MRLHPYRGRQYTLIFHKDLIGDVIALCFIKTLSGWGRQYTGFHKNLIGDVSTLGFINPNRGRQHTGFHKTL